MHAAMVPLVPWWLFPLATPLVRLRCHLSSWRCLLLRCRDGIRLMTIKDTEMTVYSFRTTSPHYVFQLPRYSVGFVSHLASAPTYKGNPELAYIAEPTSVTILYLNGCILVRTYTATCTTWTTAVFLHSVFYMAAQTKFVIVATHMVLVHQAPLEDGAY